MEQDDEKKMYQYEWEDDDNLKVKICYANKNHFIEVFLASLPLLFLIFILIRFSDLRGSPVYSLIICLVILVFLFSGFMSYFLNPIKKMSYSLIVGKSGIKNRVYKDEIFIGWEELVSLGVLENVIINSERRILIYFSNFEFDENKYRAILRKTDLNFYIGDNSEKLIAINVSDMDEAVSLKNKIQEYADKYADKT